MKVIKLVFKESKEEYYFGSYSAIYDKFTKEDIGCSIYSMWNYHTKTRKRGFVNKKVVVSEHTISVSKAKSVATKNKAIKEKESK